MPMLAACAGRTAPRPDATAAAGAPVGAIPTAGPLQMAPGVADSVRTELLASGFVLHTIVNVREPWRAFVLDVDLTHCASLRALKGASTAVGRATTSELLRRVPAAERAIGAVNADFFLFAPPGVPTNAHVEHGQLFSGPVARPVLAFEAEQGAWIDTLRVHGTLTTTHDTVSLYTWNRPTAAQAGIVDARWGVPLDSTVRDRTWRLDPVPVSERWMPKRHVLRRLIPADSLVRGDTLLLTMPPRNAPPLAPGDTVSIRMGVVGGATEAVGGRPMLVVDSLVVNDVDTEGNASFRGLNPRTAVGLTRGGHRLLLAVIDGRQPGYSVGMTLRQTADLLRALGAHTALNLDGGGSSALVLRDPGTGVVRVVNKPPDPTGERAVGNALAVLATCSAP